MNIKYPTFLSCNGKKRIPSIFNDESTGSCICPRLDLYSSHVKIGARHLGSLCSIVPFSHKKIPQTRKRYVCGKLHPRHVLSSYNFRRQMPLRTQRRHRPWRQNLELRARRLSYKRRDVVCEVRGTRLLYVIPSCKTYPCQHVHVRSTVLRLLITLNQPTNIIATFKSFLLPPQTNPFPSLVSSLSSWSAKWWPCGGARWVGNL
jgi:hypothetical protein